MPEQRSAATLRLRRTAGGGFGTVAAGRTGFGATGGPGGKGFTLAPAAPRRRAADRNDLAFGRRGKGHPEEAEPLFRESLAITRKAAGHDNVDSARTLYNLGDV